MTTPDAPQPTTSPGGLLYLYTKVAAGFLILAAIFWTVGIEPIYGHVAPFYALWAPAFAWDHAVWHVLFFGVAMTGLSGITLIDRHSRRGEPDRREVAWALVALVIWAFVFPGVVAMLRDGPAGISMAYSRSAYEYVGDIGKVRNIRELFSRYAELHPYLTMHAKVHPPGLIAILWIFSYGIGQDAMPLSVATMAFGALGVLPMYGWAWELTRNARTALTCAILYTMMPSVVLFTATSADILFMPFTLATLWLFSRSLRHGGIKSAIGAGVLYGVLGLLSFSLLSIGAYFALKGLLHLRRPGGPVRVIRLAAIMIVCAVAVHVAVYFWSGYSSNEIFRMSKMQFDTDQRHLDELDPRYASVWFKFFNPMAWFWYAGVPVSTLAIWRVWRSGAMRATWLCFALTWLAMVFLYLGRGEGERSAMYVMPFLALPAGHLIAEFVNEAKNSRLLYVTAVFLMVQCWATECFLFTYW